MKENRLVYQEIPKQSVSSSDGFTIHVVEKDETLVGILINKYKKYPTEEVLTYLGEINNLDSQYSLSKGKELRLLNYEDIKLRLEKKVEISDEVNSDLIDQEEVNDEKQDDSEKIYKLETTMKDFYLQEIKEKPLNDAIKDLQKAIGFINRNLKYNGEELNISLDDIPKYLAVMYKETHLVNGKWEDPIHTKAGPAKLGYYGYFQLSKNSVEAVRDNSELEWIHQDSKTWKVRGDNDYQYRRHVNCIYGILYLYICDRYIDRAITDKGEKRYKVVKSEEGKRKLSFMLYNRGQRTMANLWSYFEDQKAIENFADFEKRLVDHLANNVVDANKKQGLFIGKETSIYNYKYSLSYDLDPRLHITRDLMKKDEVFKDALFAEGVPRVTNKEVWTVLEYYKIIEAIYQKSNSES